MMDRIGYVTVDVFTDSRFGGNPLAVVPDARGLDDATMQQIAAEFTYSESTFVLPPDDPANTARVRIFTPVNEIPFAGHPNVGTAFVLGRAGRAFGAPVGDALRFEEGAGIVAVALERGRDGGEVLGASILAPRAPAFGPEIDPPVVAACASLAAADVAVEHHPPQMASVGLPFACAEVASLEALGRAMPDAAAFAAANRAHPHPDDFFALFLYARLGGEPLRVRARMFAPLSATPEDPATGSAAGALGALLASRTGPSRIDVTARLEGGRVRAVSIAGRCVPVMRGEIELGDRQR
jgi:trans-2,3-dihydro-3-hydroxyanthranilate isomerase